MARGEKKRKFYEGGGALRDAFLIHGASLGAIGRYIQNIERTESWQGGTGGPAGIERGRDGAPSGRALPETFGKSKKVKGTGMRPALWRGMGV